MGNAFARISPCHGGQLWNDISFSLLEPHTIHFNGATFPCHWEYTPDDDGQWRTITSYFSRRRRIPTVNCLWRIQRFIIVPNNIWILYFHSRSAQEVQRWNITGAHQGTFYNTPIKILKLNASTQQSSSGWQGPVTQENTGNIFNEGYSPE